MKSATDLLAELQAPDPGQVLAGPSTDPDRTAIEILGLEKADLICRRRHRRTFADHTNAAARFLERLPQPGESFHFLVGGNFAAWDLVPALAALAGEPIANLRLATLGFNLANARSLANMIAHGIVKRASLLCSFYFKNTDRTVYGPTAALLEPLGVRIVPYRNHAKLICAQFQTQKICCDSSANLRSCRYIEQVAIHNDPDLHDFFAAYIDRACAQPVPGRPGQSPKPATGQPGQKTQRRPTPKPARARATGRTAPKPAGRRRPGRPG